MHPISHKNPVFLEDRTACGNASPEVVGAVFPFTLDLSRWLLICPSHLTVDWGSEQVFGTGIQVYAASKWFSWRYVHGRGREPFLGGISEGLCEFSIPEVLKTPPLPTSLPENQWASSQATVWMRALGQEACTAIIEVMARRASIHWMLAQVWHCSKPCDTASPISQMETEASRH